MLAPDSPDAKSEWPNAFPEGNIGKGFCALSKSLSASVTWVRSALDLLRDRLSSLLMLAKNAPKEVDSGVWPDP
jgi:hypothetical protein